MSDAMKTPSTNEWAQLFWAALFAQDGDERIASIARAEAAMLRRMQWIFYSTSHGAERAAIESAWKSLGELGKRPSSSARVLLLAAGNVA